MINNDNNNKHRSDIPDFDPSKPMNSKREVSQSPDEKTDEDFPGYPHYPAKEDIMDQSTGSHRVDAAIANMGTGPNSSGVNQRFPSDEEGDRSKIDPLEKKDASAATHDGTKEEIGLPQNVTNDDLNTGKEIPGTDIDEAAEKGSMNP